MIPQDIWSTVPTGHGARPATSTGPCPGWPTWLSSTSPALGLHPTTKTHGATTAHPATSMHQATPLHQAIALLRATCHQGWQTRGHPRLGLCPATTHQGRARPGSRRARASLPTGGGLLHKVQSLLPHRCEYHMIAATAVTGCHCWKSHHRLDVAY